MRVFGDEFEIENRGTIGTGDVVGFKNNLHDALERRDVAADADLAILAGDPRRAQGHHFDRVLRGGKAFQRPLAQRIEHHDRHATARCIVQRRQHARTVGAGILTDDEDRVGVLEIVEKDGALADPDALGEADAGRLVAHVGAIREVVGAKLPDEQLVQKCGFVRGASRGVELGLIRAFQRAQLARDQGKGLVPGDRHIVVARGVVAHWLGEPPLLFEPIVTALLEVADSVFGKELTRDAAAGQLESHRLCAVFAELERARVFRVGPRASRAVESVGLVHRQQGLAAFANDALLTQRVCGCPQRAPAARRPTVQLEARQHLRGVSRLLGRRRVRWIRR